MNTTSTNSRAPHQYESYLSNFNDDSISIAMNFDYPGLDEYQFNVVFDTMTMELKIETDSSCRLYDNVSINFLDKVKEKDKKGRFNGKVEMMPMQLENGVLTITIVAHLFPIQRGRFEKTRDLWLINRKDLHIS